MEEVKETTSYHRKLSVSSKAWIGRVPDEGRTKHLWTWIIRNYG